MSKYHTRSAYELLLARLSAESGLLVHQDVRNMSDYQLLSLINFRLIRLDAIPFDKEELEMELVEG